MNNLLKDLQNYTWIISLVISIISLAVSIRSSKRLKDYQYNEFIVLIKHAKDELNFILNQAIDMKVKGEFTVKDAKELEELVNDFFSKINNFNNKIPTKYYAYKKDIEGLLEYSRIELFLFANESTLNTTIENLSNIKKYIKNIKV